MNPKNATEKIKQALPRKQVNQIFRMFTNFAHLEASGGIVLILTAVLALIWANSPWSESYFDFWHTELTIQVGEDGLTHDFHWWINEALMVVFFFVVGLEIKREVLIGELSSIRQAALPIAAALGGMLIPAAIYVAINLGGAGMRGWGVPMATDIAFALGVMALLGPRVPIALKVFLTALAIVDDIGAVLVIAIFYTGEISWIYLGVAAGILLALALINIFGARNPIAYALLGIGLWLAFLYSGVHATLAGILLALTIPARGKIRGQDFVAKTHAFLHEFEHAGQSDKTLLDHQQQEALLSIEDLAEKVQTPLQRLEHELHPVVTFAIIPLFALANAGVTIDAEFTAILVDRISLGVIGGLLLGKQLGITLASWLVVKTGLADLPAGVSWKQIYATSLLAGIGFTMSLFIAGLAFVDEANLSAAKVGILTASVVAGGAGYLILRMVSVDER